jgi:hypothetical protein
MRGSIYGALFVLFLGALSLPLHAAQYTVQNRVDTGDGFTHIVVMFQGNHGNKEPLVVRMPTSEANAPGKLDSNVQAAIAKVMPSGAKFKTHRKPAKSKRRKK